MLSKSRKALTMALFFVGGLQVGAMNAASAATLPSVGPIEILQTVGTGDVHKVHRRAYRHYHRRRHGRRYRRRRPGHRYYYGGWWYATPWYLGAVIAPPPRRYGRRHVRWCLDRYRSYNPRTDRFLGYDGRYHRCRSPYR